MTSPRSRGVMLVAMLLLVASVAAPVLASQTQWNCNLRAYWGAVGSSPKDVADYLGVRSGAIDGKDSFDAAKPAAPMPPMVYMYWYRTGWGTGTAYTADWRAPIAEGTSKTWCDLRVESSTLATQTLYMDWLIGTVTAWKPLPNYTFKIYDEGDVAPGGSGTCSGGTEYVMQWTDLGGTVHGDTTSLTWTQPLVGFRSFYIVVANVVENRPPTCAITYLPATPTTADLITFDSHAVDPDVGDSVANAAWDFGDGGTGNGLTTTHQYAADGTYNVTCTVTDTHGLSNSCSTSVVVGRLNTPPVAKCQDVTVSAPDGCLANASIDNGSFDPDGDPITLSQSPAGPYPLGATTVTLTVCDNGTPPLCSTCTGVVTVVDNTPPTITCADKTVSAGADCTAPCPNVVVNITENCPGTITSSQSPAIDAPLPLGATTVTVTATDAAGNTSTCTATVTVQDTTPPTITCIDQGVAAGADCTAPCPMVLGPVSDNCPGVTVVQSPNSGTVLPLGVTIVTGTATDAAGNTASCTATVTVVDDSPPVVICADKTVSAGADCTAPCPDVITSVTDNCPGVTAVQSPAAGTPLPLGVNMVTVVATDAAGHPSAVCTATVTVVDTTPPIVSCPADMTVNNDAGQCSAVVTFTSTASDNCPGVSVVCSPASGSTFPVGATVVTCTATDAAGLTAACSFTVTVVDAEKPVITCTDKEAFVGADCQVACPDVVASVSDNCPGVVVAQSPAVGNLISLGVVTVTATATDAAGNTASCTALVTVRDNTPPTITCTGDQTVSAGANCEGTCPNIVVGAADNCPGNPRVDQVPGAGSPLTLGAHVVTATATDGSGNTASCTATVTVVDTTPPTITCTDSTISAGADCKAPCPTVATATDNCPGVTVVQSPAAGTPLGLGANAVSATATDGAGLTASCTATVTVVDTTNPVITCTNSTIPARPDCTAPCPTVATATDNCDSVLARVGLIVVQSPMADTPLPLGVTIVQATATDAAGNTASCTATVTVVDTTPPTVTCVNKTVAVGADCFAGCPDVMGTLSDNCGPIITSQSPAEGAPLAPGAHTVTVTATDGAGNTASCTATVTVVDTTPPSISCTDSTLPAGADCTAPAPSVATATDNCPGVSVSQSPAAGTALPLGANAVVATATDAAGNTASCTATVTVADNTSPTITCSNSTISAGADCTAPCPAVATASDNCPGVVVSQSPAVGTALPLGANAVTATATDASGLTATCTATVTVVDTTNPVITCTNASFVVQPGETVPCPTVATASDNCPGVSVSQSTAAGTPLAVGVYTITATATDAAGNTVTCTATVSVSEGQVAPVALCKNVTVSAGANCTANADINNGSYDPNGDPITMSQSPAGPYPLGATLVTLTVCDNGTPPLCSTCTATVTVVDTTPPTVTCVDQTLPVGSGCIAACPDVIGSVSDNCPGVTTSQSPAVGTSLAPGAHVITATATDGAGNSSSCTATVTVVDTVPPGITCASSTISAGADCTAPCPSVIDGVGDNCPGVTTSQSPAVGTPLSLGANAVVATATDAAGNTASCTATVTVVDTTPPTITCTNFDLTVPAGGTVPCPTVATASDNCPGVAVAQSPAAGTPLPAGVYTVTATATDAAGNAASCTATVTVVAGNAAPVALCKDVTVSAGADCTAAADINNGSYDPDGDPITVTQSPAGPYGVGATTVTLKVCDNKGACSTCTGVVTVVDTTPPVVTCADKTVTVDENCCAPTPDVVASVSDNCPGVTVVQTPPAGTPLCFQLGNSTILVTATDAAGNTATCSATATKVDVTPPMIVCTNLTVSAGADCTAPCPVVATATDNCGLPPANLTQSPAAGTPLPLGNTTVTATATDRSGNASSCTAIVTVVDTTPPTITCSADITTGSDPGICGAVVSFTSFTTDPCGLLSLDCSAPSGSVFPVGTTTVTCTAVDLAGNSASCSFKITVLDTEAPTGCAISYTTPTPGCGETVTFTGSANDNCAITGYAWNFGDGGTGSGAVVSHAFLADSTVTLTVSDAAGNAASCNVSIALANQPPVCAVTASPNPVPMNTTVTLDASGSSDPDAACGDSVVSYSWDLNGDGTFGDATGPIATTSFADPGDHQVCVQVTDTKGAQSSCCVTVTVLANQPPVCNLTISPANPVQGGTVTATVNCVDPDGDPTTSTIDWGDGSAPVAGPTATHVYTAIGTYTVCANCFDDHGNVSQCCQTITVTSANTIDVAAITIATKANIKLVKPSERTQSVKVKVQNLTCGTAALVRVDLYRFRYRTSGALDLIKTWDNVSLPSCFGNVNLSITYTYTCDDVPAIKWKAVVTLLNGTDPNLANNIEYKLVTVSGFGYCL